MTILHQLVTLTRVGILCDTSRQSLETCRSGTAATCGGSPSGDHTLQAAHPPSNPQPTPWGKSSGSSNFDEDDQEVTFPRGGG